MRVILLETLPPEPKLGLKDRVVMVNWETDNQSEASVYKS